MGILNAKIILPKAFKGVLISIEIIKLIGNLILQKTLVLSFMVEKALLAKKRPRLCSNSLRIKKEKSNSLSISIRMAIILSGHLMVEAQIILRKELQESFKLCKKL